MAKRSKYVLNGRGRFARWCRGTRAYSHTRIHTTEGGLSGGAGWRTKARKECDAASQAEVVAAAAEKNQPHSQHLNVSLMLGLMMWLRAGGRAGGRTADGARRTQ